MKKVLRLFLQKGFFMNNNNFSRYAFVALCGLLFGCSGLVFASKGSDVHGDVKIGIVELFSSLTECGDGVEAREHLEGEKNQKIEKLKQEEQDLMKEINQFKVEASLMSEEVRLEKQKDLERKKRKLEEMAKDLEDELKLKMQRKTEALAREFEIAVQEVAKEQGFDIVIDLSTSRVVYCAKEELNITKHVVSKMDKKREIRLAEAKKQENTKVAAKKPASDKDKAKA